MHAQIDRGKASTALDIEAAEDHYISYALERLAETVGETSDLSEAPNTMPITLSINEHQSARL